MPAHVRTLAEGRELCERAACKAEAAPGATVTPDPGTRFEREYGCSEAEWLGWMPAATQGHPCSWPGPRHLRVALGAGALHLRWEPLPPRAIALVRLPRLAVAFEFEDVPATQRAHFLRVFDLHLQRGGG